MDKQPIHGTCTVSSVRACLFLSDHVDEPRQYDLVHHQEAEIKHIKMEGQTV